MLNYGLGQLPTKRNRATILVGVMVLTLAGLACSTTQSNANIPTSTPTTMATPAKITSTTTTEVPPTPLPDDLRDGRVWDIRRISRPAIDDESAFELELFEHVFALQFENDFEFGEPSIQLRIGETKAHDILIEWLGPNTFRPKEALSRQYDLLWYCPTEVSADWFFPEDDLRFPGRSTKFFRNEPISSTDFGPPPYFQDFANGVFEVSDDDESETLFLQRGPVIFSATPSKLTRFWVAAERLGPFNNAS